MKHVKPQAMLQVNNSGAFSNSYYTPEVYIHETCPDAPCMESLPTFPKQCGNTWGSYGSSKKPGWLDRGGGRGSVQNSSLFSWFRACMFVSSVNFRGFGVAATDGSGFCL